MTINFIPGLEDIGVSVKGLLPISDGSAASLGSEDLIKQGLR